MLSCEFWEIFKDTFFTERLSMAASKQLCFEIAIGKQMATPFQTKGVFRIPSNIYYDPFYIIVDGYKLVTILAKIIAPCREFKGF